MRIIIEGVLLGFLLCALWFAGFFLLGLLFQFGLQQ